MKQERDIKGLPVVYAPPFVTQQLRRIDVMEDKTILDIVRSFPDLPPRFEERGTVRINGHEIKRELWGHVRPKKPTAERPLAMTLHYAPGKLGGGGGGSGSTFKSIAAIVGAIALAVITYGIGSGFLLAGVSGGIAAGLGISLAAGQALLAGAVGIVGALALSALTAPPATAPSAPGLTSGAADDTNTDNKEAAGANGNVITPGGSIPRVVGTRKVFPPLAVYPMVELIDDDEYVEAIYVLNGPHRLEDIQIDGVPIDEVEDVEIETREGWEDDSLLSRFTSQGRMVTPGLELSVHRVDPANNALLKTPSAPLTDIPDWHSVVSRHDPDQVTIHLAFGSGLSAAGSPTPVGVPFRMRMRLRGSDDPWIYFPEFHYTDANLQQLRKTVVLKWSDDLPLVSPPASTGFTLAVQGIDLTASDPSGNASGDTVFVAHTSFIGAGTTFLYSGAEATSVLRRTNLYANRVEFYIDEAQIPKGLYEIQIKRGMLYNTAVFSKSSYSFSGTAINLFTWTNAAAPQLQFSRSNITDRVIVTRVVSKWFEYPILDTGFATIAIRAKNRSIQNLSVVASGYVKDYNSGTGQWDTWTTTSNPAPHYRDGLVGALNLDPLPLDLVGEADLVAWRALCATNDWTCDDIIDDMRTQDYLQRLASCAYAKPYQSDIYTVTVDRNTQAETPQAIFGRMNSSNFRFEKAFARVPAGLIVTYRNEDQDDDRAQTIVLQTDPTITTDNTLLESINFEGLVSEDKVRSRATFDLDQANQRNTFYFLDTDIEGLPVRRGDLVGVQNDVIDRWGADARIITRILGSPSTLIAGFTLDSEIPVTNEPDMLSMADILAVPNMLDVGITTGVAIRHYGNGVVTTHQLSNPTGSTSTITLATPITDDGTIKGFADTNDEYGCLLTSGRFGTEYYRMKVFSILPGKDMQCTLCLVDEAPNLVRFGEDPLTLMDDLTPLLAMDNASPMFAN